MKCQHCDRELTGEAELLIHQAIHAEPIPPPMSTKFDSLRQLPGALIPRVAKLMETYGQIVRVKTLASNPDLMLLSGALRHAVDLLTQRLDAAEITDEEKEQRLVFLHILQQR